MINPKFISFLLFVCLSITGISQTDTINRIDANGLKQGYWIIYGAYMPEKQYPADGLIEEGHFLDGRKVGEWKMYHMDGKTVRLIGNFQNGRPVGPYAKYNINGLLIETGTYKNGRQIGEFKIYYESGCLSLEKTFDVEGRQTGEAFHYADDCLIDSTKRGSIIFVVPQPETKFYEYGHLQDSCRALPSDVSAGTGGPCGDDGRIKDGKKFQPDGYNRVYDKNDELWLEGTFKSCRLWDGKIYKFDGDGILLKIEIWKNGAYCCDGQL